MLFCRTLLGECFWKVKEYNTNKLRRSCHFRNLIDAVNIGTEYFVLQSKFQKITGFTSITNLFFIKQFHVTVLFLPSLKSLKKYIFSDIFRELERDQWQEIGEFSFYKTAKVKGILIMQRKCCKRLYYK